MNGRYLTSFDGSYLTSFSGELALKRIKPQAVKKIITLIKQKGLLNVMCLSEDSQTLYIYGKIDNTSEVMEHFMVTIFPLVDISNSSIVQAQGDSINDRYDLVYQEDGLYIQQYVLRKEKIVKYQT